MQHIFLAGASRGVGREIAKILLENEPSTFKLTALLRNPTYTVELEALGATVVMGDALDREQCCRPRAAGVANLGRNSQRKGKGRTAPDRQWTKLHNRAPRGTQIRTSDRQGCPHRRSDCIGYHSSGGCGKASM